MKDEQVWDYPSLRVMATRDLSGVVTMYDEGGRGINVRGEDLRAFVADFIRDRKIGVLETASTEEILTG